MSIRLLTYQPEYRADFIALNIEWIEHYFEVETLDRQQLETLEDEILKPGGEIFFAVETESDLSTSKSVAQTRVLGTCAMIPHGHQNGRPIYELAKMAVTPAARGKGIGDILMIGAINWAKEKNAHSVELISNQILTPAITLYKKHGFETTSLEQNPLYKRGNIEMRLSLE